MIGKTILHYKIIEKLGEGGMGIVYLAEDTKLERQVAIKFLPHHIAANSDERKRFEIEAKAAAALNHPNIATIHAIEETEDDLFLVMEYISGKHLKDHVKTYHDTSQQMPQPEAIDIATQIAKGLQAAHKKGIVHRDIKSANIMSKEDGHIKIMDFGLAKFRGSVQLTQIGTTVGTAAYMSPEQARGEEADQRADIWSFGVVFYEMLSGHPPFKGEYEQALIYNLLNEDIVPVSEIIPDIPQEINDIVNKCLEKDKEKRYQSMDEVLADLKEGSSTSQISINASKKGLTKGNKAKSSNILWPAIGLGIIVVLFASWFMFMSETEKQDTSKKMLVVLPFENLGDTENAYFAEGITAEITSRLSGLSGLGVIARTSAGQYKDTNKSLKQIADELGIAYVLMGTVQWQQMGTDRKRVRVNSELIQVQNSTQIWSKPYDADFADAFQLQSDIAAQVASALNLKLLRTEKRVLDEKLTDNPKAYDLYMQASNFYERSYNEADWVVAERLYKQAIAQDNNFIVAHARLSNLQSDKYWFFYDRSEENLQASWNNIQKAKQLNPNHYMVTEVMGWYHYHVKLDYESALKEFYISLESQPNNPGVLMGIASVLRRQGKMEEALEYFRKCVDADPRSSLAHDQLGETLVLVRQYDEAEKYFDIAISLAPEQGNLLIWKARTILFRNKDIRKAKEITSQISSDVTVDRAIYIYINYLLRIIERNYQAALEFCDEFTVLDDQFSYFPNSLLKAKIYNLAQNRSAAENQYKQALSFIQEKLLDDPEDPRYYSTLGLIYAGLGKKEEAIEAGKKATQLMPVSMEAWRGGWRVYDLAEIYLQVAEYQKALQTLEQVLSMPLDISINIIELDPTWDPIKELPGYKQLLKKYAVN